MTARAILDGTPASRDTLRTLLSGEGDLMDWVREAYILRHHHFGRGVRIHVLDNVQNGACPEDCGYCGQAKTSESGIAPWTLKSTDEIVADAEAAKDSGAYRFCMVMSGRGPADKAVDRMAETIRSVKERTGLKTCLSAGLMSNDQLARLKAAGLDRLNHNLNTSEGFYDKICTTHDWGDRQATLKAARQQGVELCSGYIFGMGEGLDDRVDMCAELQVLQPESIPVNFLLPIEGNRVHEPKDLSPETCLRILCAVRLAAPASEVRVAAGREYHLRSLQALSLWPANSLFADGYLLAAGEAPDSVTQMILDAGFMPENESGRPLTAGATPSTPAALKPSVSR